MNINFKKALLYLDKNQHELAENYLNAAMADFSGKEHTIEFISICCCYGEFLFRMQRSDEALKYLNRVIDYYQVNAEPEFEYQRACQLVEAFENME